MRAEATKAETRMLQKESILHEQIDGVIYDRNSFKQLASAVLANDFNVKKLFRSEYEDHNFQEELKKIDQNRDYRQKILELEKLNPLKENKSKATPSNGPGIGSGRVSTEGFKKPAAKPKRRLKAD
jgi:hypothetical protein